VSRQALPCDPQPYRQAALIDAAAAVRDRAASARADALSVGRQRPQRDRILESAATTIHQARETLAGSHSSCHFGLDWHDADHSLDFVLVVHEP
jgi:hypothetical protein